MDTCTTIHFLGNTIWINPLYLSVTAMFIKIRADNSSFIRENTLIHVHHSPHRHFDHMAVFVVAQDVDDLWKTYNCQDDDRLDKQMFRFAIS